MYGTRVPSSQIVLFSHMFCTPRHSDDETENDIVDTYILPQMPAVVGVDDDHGRVLQLEAIDLVQHLPRDPIRPGYGRVVVPAHRPSPARSA